MKYYKIKSQLIGLAIFNACAFICCLILIGVVATITIIIALLTGVLIGLGHVLASLNRACATSIAYGKVLTDG